MTPRDKKGIIDVDKLESILPEVTKPGRYVGGEMNLPDFDNRNPAVRCLLAFPDVYDIGMSYFGFKILYELINAYDEYQAERVFSPWVDMEEKMRRSKIPLYSLDTFAPAADFDVIGFTLQHELSYTNVLNMLDLAGLKLRSCDRQEPLPLIIAGGPSAYNPEPIADFIDCFVIGDGEDAIIEILEAVKEFKSAEGKTKSDLLKRLSQLEGIYVPGFYDVRYRKNIAVETVEKNDPEVPDVVQKRTVDISDGRHSVRNPLVPYLKIIQDRFVIEARRGCSRGCRFCNAGMATRPVRERSIEDILEIAQAGIDNTGFNEISLLSLSTTDHSAIEGVVRYLTDAFRERKVSIGLPSLRINSFDVSLAQRLKLVRKSGLTFAPEAGTDRLRAVINKSLSEDEFLSIVKDVFIAGWHTIKLYFMIGLPTETYEDLDGIIAMIGKIRVIARQMKGGRAKINVSLSPFIPKPNTPFQWEKMLDADEIRKRYSYVEQAIRSKTVSVKRHNIDQTILEATFSRGDRRLGNVLLSAFESGCRFDGWDDVHDVEKWREAFQAHGVNPTTYTSPDISPDDTLPWDHISAGIDKRYLVSERNSSREGETTIDCVQGSCVGCGVCESPPEYALAKDAELNLQKIFETVEKIKKKSFTSSLKSFSRVRVKFSKQGPLKFVSHLDLIKSLNLLFRRTGLSFFYTKGFNPQAKVQYSPPLPVGFESVGDYFDLFLSEPTDASVVLKELQRQDQKYLKFLEAFTIPLKGQSLEASIVSASYRIVVTPFEENKSFFGVPALIEKIKEFYSKSEMLVDVTKRKGKTKTLDLRRIVYKILVEEDEHGGVLFNCVLSMGKKGTLNPIDALALILELDIRRVGRLSAVRTGFGFAGTQRART